METFIQQVKAPNGTACRLLVLSKIKATVSAVAFYYSNQLKK